MNGRSMERMKSKPLSRESRRSRNCICHYQRHATLKPFNRRVVRQKCIEKQQRFYESVLQKSLETVEILSRTDFGSKLLEDPYLDILASGENRDKDDEAAALTSRVATRYLDDCLMKCLESMPDIKQVVLLGTTLDTRPYRMSFPKGTIVFDIGPKAVQEYKFSKLKDSSICSGCLHIHLSIPVGDKMQKVDTLLHRRGYQGSKPSIWVLQGMESYCATVDKVEDMLDSVSHLMSMDSIIIGSHADVSHNVMKTILAGCLLHGDSFSGEKILQSYKPDGETEGLIGPDLSLFSARQTRRSDSEMEIYLSHTAAVEEVDEDYFDNII